MDVDERDEMAEAAAKASKEALSVWLSNDEMKVLASGEVVPGSEEAALKELRGKLHALGLNDERAVAEAVAGFQRASASGSAFEQAVVLEGRPPVPPKDGRVVWARDFFAKGFYVDPETGAADYRRLTADVNVGEGDLLATVTEPEAGEEGRDVFGHAVPPRAPKEAHLRAGSNVRCDEGTRQYFAAASGRIRHVGGVVSVDDVLNIQGSAGLVTGHINHPGALVINENINPRTEVTTQGDIEVQGYVDGAVVRCGGNLVVHGGITGGPGSRIEVAGNVFALFLANVELDAEGDVYVQREVNLSKVRARGTVEVESGRISGGEVCALGGISAERIGTEAGVPTVLLAGYDYKLNDRIEALHAEQAQLTEEARKIQEKVAPLKSRLDKLPPPAREAVSKLLLQLREITGRQQEIQAEAESLHTESEARRKSEVYVKRSINPEVSVTISKLTLLTREVFEGPLRVAIMDGDIRLASTRLRR